jgi:hypothetical protein
MIQKRRQRSIRSFGKTNFEGLGMQRVGPKLWLKMTHPHREIRFDHPGKSRGEVRSYLKMAKRTGTYVNGLNGWGCSRIIMMGGFVFAVSDKLYHPRELAKRRRKWYAKKQRLEAESVTEAGSGE